MSDHRPPAFCAWSTLLIVPVVCFLLLVILLYLLTPPPASAQTTAGNGHPAAGHEATYDHATMAPVIMAGPLDGRSVSVDGVLDEEVWQSVSPYSAFIQRAPDEGQPVSERTEVRILVGPDALYVGGRFFDREPNLIRATLVRRDVVSDFDYVMVSLDSRHDHNTAYAFTLTPSGAYQDAALGVDGEYDFGWDPVWEGAARIDAEGWSAEWKIPFSQLRFKSSEDAEWGIQVVRVIARKQESAYMAFTPRNESSGPHRFGHLRGLGQVREPSRLELLPFLTSRSEHLNVSPGDPFRSESELFYDAGLDIKYGITGQLTLDATLNPDFGQVEVDPAVVNLTQYESYFPERRPFFVEGAEIFRFGFPGFEMNGADLGDLFYSRRIGRAPQRDLGTLGARYADVPSQSTIAGAMKVSGRSGAWSLGLMEAATLEEEGRYADGNGERHSVVVEPFTNNLVGRARRDFRDGSTTVGGILTTVNRDLAEPALKGTLHSGAYVAGLDFIHMWNNREWFLTGTLSGSRVQGSPEAMLRTQRSAARYWQRPDAGHVGIDSTRTSMEGWRGSLSAGRRAGDHWRGSLLVQAKSPGFEANDLGFETRVDSWKGSLALQYRDMEPDERTRFYQVDLVSSFERNFDGDLLGVDFFLGSVQEWPNFWQSSTALSVSPETDNDRLTRGGPVARTPAVYSVSQWIGTDRRKSYAFNLNATWSQNVRGGWGVFPSMGVTLHPTSATEVSIDGSLQRIHAVAQYVGRVSDPTAERTYEARYLFSDLDQTILALPVRVSWTFTPDLSFQLYARPFLASGDYSRFKELHRPRSWGWDVYGTEIGTLTEVEGGYRVDPDGEGPAASFDLRNPDFNLRSLRGNAVLRWEYRPGSTLYLVWQQQRFDSAPFGEFRLRDGADALFHVQPENVFAIKVSYWMGI